MTRTTKQWPGFLLLAALLWAPIGAPGAQDTTPPPPAADKDKKKDAGKPAAPPQLSIPVPGPSPTAGGSTTVKAGSQPAGGVATGEIVLGNPGASPAAGQPVTGTVVVVGDPAKKVTLGPSADPPPATGTNVGKDAIQLPPPPARDDVKLSLDPGGQTGSPTSTTTGGAKNTTGGTPAPSGTSQTPAGQAGSGQPSPGQTTTGQPNSGQASTNPTAGKPSNSQPTTGQAGQSTSAGNTAGNTSGSDGSAGSATSDTAMPSSSGQSSVGAGPTPTMTTGIHSSARDCVAAGGDCPCPEEQEPDPGALRDRSQAGADALLDATREPAAPLLWERTIDDERAMQQQQMSRLAAAAEERKQARAAAEARRLTNGELPDEIQKALLRWYADHGLNLDGAPLSYYVEGTDPVDGRRPVNVRVAFRTSLGSNTHHLRFRWTHGLGRLEWIERPELSLDDLVTLFDARALDAAAAAAGGEERKQNKPDGKAQAAKATTATAKTAQSGKSGGGSSSGGFPNGVCGNGAGWKAGRFGPRGGGGSSSDSGPAGSKGSQGADGGSCPPETGRGPDGEAADEGEAAPGPPTAEEQIAEIDEEIARRTTLVNKLINVPGKNATETIGRLKQEIGELEGRKQRLAAGGSPVVSQADEAWQKDAAVHVANQTERVARLERKAVERSQEADAAAEAYGKALAEVASGKRDAAALSALRARMDASRALASGTAKLLATQRLLLDALAGTVALAMEAGATPALPELLGDGRDPERAIVALAGEAARLEGGPPLDVAAAEAELRARLAAAAAEEEAAAEKRDAFLDGQERLAARAGEFAASGVVARLEEREAQLEQWTAERDHYRAGLASGAVDSGLAKAKIAELEAKIDETGRRIRVDRSLVRAFNADVQTIEGEMPRPWELDPQARAAAQEERLLAVVELTIEAAHAPLQRALVKTVLSEEIARLRAQGTAAAEQKLADVQRVLDEKDRVLASRERATRMALEGAFDANHKDGIGPASEAELRAVLAERGLALDPALALSDAQRERLVAGIQRVVDGSMQSGAASKETSFAADVARELLAQAPKLLDPLHTTKAAAGAIYGAGSHLVHAAADLADLGGEVLAADTDLSRGVRLALGPAGWVFGTSLVADAFGTDKIEGIDQLVELVQKNDRATIAAQLDRAAWQGIRKMQQGDAVWNNAKFGGAVAIEGILLGLSGGSRGAATAQQVGLDLARLASATSRVLDRSAKLGKLAGTPTLGRALEGAAGASTKIGRGLEGVIHASRAKAAAKAASAGPADDASRAGAIARAATSEPTDGASRAGTTARTGAGEPVDGVPTGTTLVEDTQVATRRPAAGGAADEPWVRAAGPPLGHVYTSQDRIRLGAFLERTGEIRPEYVMQLVRFWEAKGLEPAAVMAGRALMRGLSPQVLETSAARTRALLHRYLRDVEGIGDAARRDGLIERFLRSGDGTLPAATPRPTPPTSGGGAVAAAERGILDEPTVIVHENQRVARAGSGSIYDDATVVVHESQRMPRAAGDSIYDQPTVIVHESQRMPRARGGADAPTAPQPLDGTATSLGHATSAAAQPLDETATSLGRTQTLDETTSRVGRAAPAAPALDPPRTIGEVLRRIRNVNPGFPDEAGRATNCTECVEAVERILRGEDAALVRAGLGDDSYTWFQLNSRAAVAHIDPVLDRARDWIRVGSQQQIEELMAATPPGSFARVWGKRAGAHGHVFNVWNDGARVWFLDGQVGSLGTFAGQGYTELSLLLTGF